MQRQLGGGDMDAYERVLTDAMAGDATLFARQDYVEEAWRIVDPALKAGTPVFEYAPQTWGPQEVERVTPPGGWQNPIERRDHSISRARPLQVLASRLVRKPAPGRGSAAYLMSWKFVIIQPVPSC